MRNRVLQLAIPMILSNLTIPLLGLVDTAVMGHLPYPHYLAATGIGAMLFDLFYWCFGFLRMATTGLASQSFGTNDYAQMTMILLRHVAVALLVGVGLIALQVPLMWASFHLIDASATVTHYAKLYYSYRIWGAPAALINMVLLGWFIGLQKPKYPLILMVTINLLAAILDVIFVYGFGMSTDGVALASVIAQYVGCVIGAFAIYTILKPHAWRWPRGALFAKESLHELFHVNRDIFIRTLGLLIVFLAFTRQGAQFGATVLAANVVLMNLQDTMAFALDGFANAAEALVGEAFGKCDKQLLFKAMHHTAWFSVSVAVMIAIIYAIFGGLIIDWLTAIKVVRETARDFLVFMIVSPLICVWGFWLDGIFVGATWVKPMRNTMLIAVGVFFVMLWLLSGLANTGLWIAFLSFMGLRAIGMAVWLLRHTRTHL